MESYIFRYNSTPHNDVSRLLTALSAITNVPSTFIDRKIFRVTDICYYPVYVFQFSWNVNWTASFGYWRYEEKLVYDKSSEKWKTVRHQVTDWRPGSGHDADDGALTAYAGTAATDREVSFIQQFILQQDGISSFQGDFGSIRAEKSILSPDAVWRTQCVARANAVVDNSVRRHSQGDRSKDWHWTGQVGPDGEPDILFYLSIVHIKGTYQGKDYSFRVYGHDCPGLDYESLPTDTSHVLIKVVPWILCALSAVILINVDMAHEIQVSIFGVLLIGSAINHFFQNAAAQTRRKAALEDHLRASPESDQSNTKNFSEDPPGEGSGRDQFDEDSAESDDDADSFERDEPDRPAPGAMGRKEALEILGLTGEASNDEIKAAYRALIKKLHPDVGGNAYLTRKLNEAYQTLKGQASADERPQRPTGGERPTEGGAQAANTASGSGSDTDSRAAAAAPGLEAFRARSRAAAATAAAGRDRSPLWIAASILAVVFVWIGVALYRAESQPTTSSRQSEVVEAQPPAAGSRVVSVSPTTEANINPRSENSGIGQCSAAISGSLFTGQITYTGISKFVYGDQLSVTRTEIKHKDGNIEHVSLLGCARVEVANGAEAAIYKPNPGKLIGGLDCENGEKMFYALAIVAREQLIFVKLCSEYQPNLTNKSHDIQSIVYYSVHADQSERSDTVARDPQSHEDSSVRISLAEALKRGQVAFESKNYRDAMSWYLKAADQGDPQAEHALGDLYKLGQGVDVDYLKAMTWYMKAAARGYAPAERDIGWLYLNGWGVPVDASQAMSWIRKAADQGDASAEVDLGTLLGHGYSGIQADPAQSIFWERKAADQGNAYAQYNVGLDYENGSGTARDVDQAREWYQRAASQGLQQANQALARIEAEKEKLSVAATRLPSPPTHEEISADDALRRGKQAENAKNYSEAMSWWRKAADQGNAEAEADIGVLYANGFGVQVDYAQAMFWSRRAADLGNTIGQKNVGTLYANGYGVQVDYAQAMYWWMKAASAGDADAQNSVGVLYAQGLGVPKDCSIARAWFQRAAAGGNSNARASLSQSGLCPPNLPGTVPYQNAGSARARVQSPPAVAPPAVSVDQGGPGRICRSYETVQNGRPHTGEVCRDQDGDWVVTR